jgi:Amt family ammonium transporter
MARTRKGTRSGHGKRHNGKATLPSTTEQARSRARITIVGGDSSAAAGELRSLDALPRYDLRTTPVHKRITAPVNGHRRTVEQTQIAEDFGDPPDEFDLDRDPPPEPAEDAASVALIDDDACRVLDAAWARTLRFARSATWTLPAGAFGFALVGVWGWPTPAAGPTGQAASAWLVITLISLALTLVGGVALTGLLGATPGRYPAAGALVAMLTGTVVFVPVVGLVGVARPAIANLPAQIRVGGMAGSLDARLLDGPLVRWLGAGGLVLLGAGWFAMGCAVLISGVLNRVDGTLLMLAVSVAVTAGYLSWQFLLVIAAMVMVAGGLGLAWTAWRLAPDGQLPDDDPA